MRPMTSQKVIDIVANLVDAQDEKGIKKYGVTIDDAKDEQYDWNVMALEELVDGMKYEIKENQRLREEIKKLKSEVNHLETKIYDLKYRKGGTT